jgi:proteic killer suppression protein
MFCITEHLIKTFRDKRAAAVFAGKSPKGFPTELRARARMVQIDVATTLDDLRLPSSNHLEALRYDSAGQHSVRINNQWRICFVWREQNAYEVEIVDYH